MGKLIYGSPSMEIDLDDRVLAHVKVAMLAKLRRDEQFALSWNHGAAAGSGRSTIWVHPAIPLRFIFSGNTAPSLNRQWVEDLMDSANGPGGMLLVPEPDGQ